MATCNVFRVHYILLLHTRTSTSTFIHSGRRDSKRSRKGAERGGKGRKRGGRERGMMLYCTNVDCSVNLEVNILT